MPRMSLSLSEEADKELKQLSEQTGKPIALLIREAIDVYLADKLGRSVKTHIKWGGYRGRNKEDKDADGE